MDEITQSKNQNEVTEADPSEKELSLTKKASEYDKSIDNSVDGNEESNRDSSGIREIKLINTDRGKNTLYLNLQSDGMSESSSPTLQEGSRKKKRRSTINLMSSEEDLNAYFKDETRPYKQSSDTDQFVLQGLSSQEIEKVEQHNSSGSNEGSGKKILEGNRLYSDNVLSDEDEEELSRKIEMLDSSSEIDEQRLQMMRRELQYQLFDNKHSSLFSRQRGKLSVDLKDLEDDDEEDGFQSEDQESDEEEDDEDDDDEEYQQSQSNSKNNKNGNTNLKKRKQEKKKGLAKGESRNKINSWVELQNFISTTGTDLRDLEINEFIENINNFYFENILDYSPTQKPLFKFLAEIIKKEINNVKRVQDTFKMDSIYMKFIQCFTKRTSIQIFFSDSFKIPLYSIIKLNKIIKIDPSKITLKDVNYKKGLANSQQHQHHNFHQHNLSNSGNIQLNQSLTASGGGGAAAGIDFRHTHDAVLKINTSQEGEPRASIPQNNRNTTGFLNSFFSLFTSTDSKKKRKDSNILNESILQPPVLINHNSSSCSNIDNIDESSLNLNSQDSALTRSVESSVVDETEEDRLIMEERKAKEVENNLTILKQITTQIIDSLTKHVSNIPKGIKIMCKMIVILLGEKDPTLSMTEKLSVLSQFLIMRWVIPSMVSLLHRNTLTELHQLRYQNISIVTKVLQKIFKKEHDNLTDYPGLDKLRPFIKDFSERIDQFYDYLLNFDGGFIEELITKEDAQLFQIKEDGITSLSVSFNDVDLILKIFSSVQDDKLKSEHKKLFTQIEKCIKINDSEKFLDSSSKNQQNTLFYIWKPADFYTSNLVDKCFKFQVKDKTDQNHVMKQKLINVLIQFFQKVNPSEDFIENQTTHELQGILNFYGRRNKMSQKIMQNGLQVKIQSNFIKSLLKKLSADYDTNSFQSLLHEIQSEILERKQSVIDQIKYIKYKIQQAISKLSSQTMKIKKENDTMQERTMKQNKVLSKNNKKNSFTFE